MSDEPSRPRVSRAREMREAYLMARDGSLPIEALTQDERWQLVAELHRTGWTDQDIAGHTRATEYTIARIRTAMGLKPNLRGG